MNLKTSPAQITAGLIKNAALKREVLGRIDLVNGADTRADNWRRLADKRVAAGDIPFARRTRTVAARSDAGMIPDDPERCYRLLEITIAPGKIYELADAQETLVAAQEAERTKKNRPVGSRYSRRHRCRFHDFAPSYPSHHGSLACQTG